MAVPTLSAIEPTRGPSAGGDLVRITGTGFGAKVAVYFGNAQAEVIALRSDATVGVVDIRTPPHGHGLVDVTVYNLDADGEPIAGEEAAASQAYRFEKAQLVHEADLTRLVRVLLRRLKDEVLSATSLTVSVDYDDTQMEGHSLIALASLPSIVLSGPRMVQNRFYSTNVAHEDVVTGPEGPELLRRRPAYTVDLSFTLTAASDRTVELLNMMAAVATFLNRLRFIDMLRDPGDASKATVRWEMDPEGEYRTRLDGPDDVRAFTCGFLVRGFDIDEGLPATRSRVVDEIDVDADALVIEGKGEGV